MIILENAFKGLATPLARYTESNVAFINQALVLTPEEASASIPTTFMGGLRGWAIHALRGFFRDHNADVLDRAVDPIRTLLIEEVIDPRRLDTQLTIERSSDDAKFLRVVKKWTPMAIICDDIDDSPDTWEIRHYDVKDPDKNEEPIKRYAFLLRVSDEGDAYLAVWDTDAENGPAPINLN